ncbi:MAG: hypothetical protein ACI4WM_05015 [Erysipelotrichaceae bacterium]
MKISVRIINAETVNESIVDSNDINCFSYIDGYGSFNTVNIGDGCAEIYSKASDHRTLIHLCQYENSFIELFSSEGSLHFEVKIVEFIQNQSIITIAYSLEEAIYRIEITLIQEK